MKKYTSETKKQGFFKENTSITKTILYGEDIRGVFKQLKSIQKILD